MKRFAAIALIAALGLVSSAASCGSARDTAGKIIVASETALHIAEDAELALRCGQPTAPAAPKCITPELHAKLKLDLLRAWDIWKKGQALYASLPPTGTPSISEITTLIAQVGAIIQEVVTGFPDAGTQATVLAKPEVASTLKVK